VLLNAGIIGASAGGGAYDPDAQAYIDRLTGTYSGEELDAINQFFVTLKADSLYSGIVACHLYALDNASDAVLNIKGATFTASNNSLAFTARQGFTGNSGSGFIDTGVTPSVAMTVNSATYGFYVRNGSDGITASDMGGRASSGSAACSLRANTTGTPLATIHSSSIPAGVTSSHVTGMQLWIRTSSTVTTHYTRGTSNGTASITSSGLPTVAIYLANSRTGAPPSTGTDRQYAMDIFAEGWDATQSANFSGAVELLLDAFGAGVV
jgi:hypothetical protein